MALAMMGQSMMGQYKKPDEPLLKPPDLSGMLAGLNTPVQGLTAGQKDVMKARLAAQGKTGLRNVLEQLGTALGQSSTAFALNSARMRQGAGSDVAAQMANVDVGQAEANRAAEFQRRAQTLQGAGLQGQLFGIEKGAETSRYGIDQSKGLQGTLAGIEAAFKSGQVWPGSEAETNLMRAISQLAGVDLTKGRPQSQFHF